MQNGTEYLRYAFKCQEPNSLYPKLNNNDASDKQQNEENCSGFILDKNVTNKVKSIIDKKIYKNWKKNILFGKNSIF